MHQFKDKSPRAGAGPHEPVPLRCSRPPTSFYKTDQVRSARTSASTSSSRRDRAPLQRDLGEVSVDPSSDPRGRRADHGPAGPRRRRCPHDSRDRLIYIDDEPDAISRRARADRLWHRGRPRRGQGSQPGRHLRRRARRRTGEDEEESRGRTTARSSRPWGGRGRAARAGARAYGSPAATRGRSSKPAAGRRAARGSPTGRWRKWPWNWASRADFIRPACGRLRSVFDPITDA